jgi:hypothetical protein
VLTFDWDQAVEAVPGYAQGCLRQIGHSSFEGVARDVIFSRRQMRLRSARSRRGASRSLSPDMKPISQQA